jgi:hypothetical protein
VVYGHKGTNDTGIYLQYQASAVSNVVHDNTFGVNGNTRGDVASNRIYNNSTGIRIYASYGNVNVYRNVVYSNLVGVDIQNSGNYANNIIYDNSNRGVLITSASGVNLLNNTIYQPQGDAVRIQTNSSNINLTNNILWVDKDDAISVAQDSQQGFQSNYNLFYLTGISSIGLWQGQRRNSLNDWRNASFTDKDSIFANPLFIDADGEDNILGYDSPSKDGRDDDFHLQSLYGSYQGGSFTPVIDIEKRS